MEKLLDAFDSGTGWTGSSALATVHGVNTVPEYIAGLNTGSLVFKFAAGALNAYVTKTVSFNSTGYTELVFHFWSRNKRQMGVMYKKASDFSYKIDLGGGNVFYVPTYSRFDDVTISIAGITSITQIRITCLHNDEDYIIVSNMVAVKDELPADIFRGLKTQLESDIAAFYPRITAGVASKGILIGSITGAIGDKSIVFSSTVNWIEKYSVVYIDDGANSETHQIDHTDGREFWFNTKYSGAALTASHSAKNVYLTLPVEYGLSESEIILPGIHIWGMSPEEVLRSNKLDTDVDTMNAAETVRSRLTSQSFMYILLIDCEARHNAMIAAMSEIVRSRIAMEYFWCNGKKLNIRQGAPSTYIDATEGYNQIPKIQFNAEVEVREEYAASSTLVKNTTNTRTYEIRSIE